MKKLLICLLSLATVHVALAADKSPKAGAAVAAKKAPDTADERAARRADIDHWLSAYDGSEFTSGDYRCPSPRFPGVSKQNEDIKRVQANMEAWEDCHNKAVAHFNAQPSFAALIPADVARLLTPAEKEQATARLLLVHDNVAETLKVQGSLTAADFSAWRDATQTWVKEHNDIVQSGPSEERQRDINARRENYAQPTDKR